MFDYDIYMRRIFSRYSKRCDSEGITSLREYDEKYGIHYDSAPWLKLLIQLLSKPGTKDELKEVLNTAFSIPQYQLF